MMLGIDSDRKALVSFALGSGLSAFAAVLILPLGSIVVETGYNVLIYSIAVSIIGGLGSRGGAIVASFIIGFAQILTEVFLSTQYQMVISLLAIIVTLLLKPSGIFGKQKEAGRPRMSDGRDRKERIDRGIKVRSDGLYAVSSLREMLYLSGPADPPDRRAAVAALLLDPFPLLEAGHQHPLRVRAAGDRVRFPRQLRRPRLPGRLDVHRPRRVFAAVFNVHLHLPVYLSIPAAALAGAVVSTLLILPCLSLRGCTSPSSRSCTRSSSPG